MLWLVAGGVVMAAFVAGLLWLLAAPSRPEPTGPHAIGTTLYGVETQHDAPVGPPEGRELELRAFYPTDAPTATLLPSLDARTQAAMSKLYGVPMGSGGGPDSHAAVDAPVLSGRHPVVVFSHGAFSFAQQSMTLLQELASHGFIVLAVGHASEAVLALLPGDRSVPIDPRLDDAMSAQGRLAPEVYAQYLAALDRCRAPRFEDGLAAARDLGRAYVGLFEAFEVGLDALSANRLDDLATVLEHLSVLDASGPLAAHLDLERVALIGHSLGGWTSLATSLTHEVQAVVSLDMPLFVRPHMQPTPLSTPSLHLWAEASRLPGGHVAYTTGTNAWLRGEATWWEATLQGASHMNFSDLSLMPRLLRYTGLLGSADGGWLLRTTNAIIGAFLRNELMGATEATPTDDGIVWVSDG